MSKRTHYVAMGYKVNQHPPGASPADAVRVMADVFLGKPLPDGWDITWRHTNNPLRPMRENPIQVAAMRSRATFGVLALNRLRRDARRFGFKMEVPEPREVRGEELEQIEEAIEREEEEFAARLSEETSAVIAEQHRKRSAAARKGWVTRRRHQAEAEAARKKRSQAAKRKRRK